jgi:hypothetical protein
VNAAGATTAETTPGRESTLAVLLVLLFGIVVCRLAVLSSDWGYDTGAWMYVSQRLLAGARIYVDITDNKLPPLYWVGALYLKTGAPRAAMFVAETALTLVSALALASILRKAGLGARLALLFGALFVCAAQPAWEYAHRLESYALAPLSIGLALLAWASLDDSRQRIREHFLAGALVALAVSFRAQHVIDALLVGLWVLTVSSRARFARFAAYAAGGIAWAAALLAIAWSGGYLQAMLQDAVLDSAGYAAGHAPARPPKLGSVIWALRTNVDLMPVAWIAVGGGLVLAAAGWRRVSRAQQTLLALAVVLFGAQFLSTFIARHQIIHYHFPLGWTAALIAGLGVAAAHLRLGERAVRAAWLTAAATAVLIATTAFPDARVYAGVHGIAFGKRDRKVDQLERLAREHLPADAPVYFLDDYAMAGILTRVPNPPATPRAILAMQARFLDPQRPPEDTSPYGLTTLAWGRDFRAEMERDPPRWLVRTRAIEDELAPWVRAHYREVASSEDFTVWQLAEPR